MQVLNKDQTTTAAIYQFIWKEISRLCTSLQQKQALLLELASRRTLVNSYQQLCHQINSLYMFAAVSAMRHCWALTLNYSEVAQQEFMHKSKDSACIGELSTQAGFHLCMALGINALFLMAIDRSYWFDLMADMPNLWRESSSKLEQQWWKPVESKWQVKNNKQ